STHAIEGRVYSHSGFDAHDQQIESIGQGLAHFQDPRVRLAANTEIRKHIAEQSPRSSHHYKILHGRARKQAQDHQAKAECQAEKYSNPPKNSDGPVSSVARLVQTSTDFIEASRHLFVTEKEVGYLFPKGHFLAIVKADWCAFFPLRANGFQAPLNSFFHNRYLRGKDQINEPRNQPKDPDGY